MRGGRWEFCPGEASMFCFMFLSLYFVEFPTECRAVIQQEVASRRVPVLVRWRLSSSEVESAFLVFDFF